MRTKVKFMGILFITLCLGFAIGFLVQGIIFHEHFRKLEALRQGDGIVRLIGERLRLSPSQKEATDPVLKKYGDRLRAFHRHFNKELFTTLDSLKLDLEPFLSEEQNKLLSSHRGFGPDFRHGPLSFFNNPRARFINHFTNAIEPTAAQKDTVVSILNKYAPTSKSGSGIESDSLHAHILAMLPDLKRVVTIEQFNRLLDMLPPDMPLDSTVR